MVLWVLHEEIALRIKKLNDKNLTSNHYTQQSLNFVNQQFLLPEINEIISLNLGYRVNEFWTKVDGIYITCPLGKRKILWAINLDDKISHETNITLLPAPKKEEGEERRGQVRPRNRDISGGEKDNASGGHQ
jgi:hypothetical protein